MNGGFRAAETSRKPKSIYKLQTPGIRLTAGVLIAPAIDTSAGSSHDAPCRQCAVLIGASLLALSLAAPQLQAPCPTVRATSEA